MGESERRLKRQNDRRKCIDGTGDTPRAFTGGERRLGKPCPCAFSQGGTRGTDTLKNADKLLKVESITPQKK